LSGRQNFVCGTKFCGHNKILQIFVKFKRAGVSGIGGDNIPNTGVLYLNTGWPLSHTCCGMWSQGTPARSALRFSQSGSFHPAGGSRAPELRGADCVSDFHEHLSHDPAGEKMPFQKSALEPLDAVINVRLTTSEKIRLKEDADFAGISVSALVRRRYFGRPIIANADAVMIKELRRLGGQLKHIHNQSSGAYSLITARALRAVTAYIDRLSRDRQKG
jgi:hypothetical protein